MTVRIEFGVMRRFVVLVLLVVMQLQLAWGAVATYCEHESRGTAAANHLGHHEHRHATADTATEPSGVNVELGKFLGSDPDCQSCHFASLGTVPTPPATRLAKLDLAPATAPQPSFASFIPDGPDRPDRRTHTAA